MIVQRLDVTDSCRLWDDVKGSENLRGAINTLSECDFPYLPHSDTLKYLAERLDPEHLNEVLCKSFVCMRKAKRLSSFKCGKYFLIAIDGVEFNKSFHPIPHCCHRKLSNGKVEYFQAALVVTLISPSGLRLPLMVEFIKNNEGAKEYDKQDCEYKAFLRLAVKLKKRFPLQNFCLLLDGLYFKAEVINLIEKFLWKYIITWKYNAVKRFTQIAKTKIGRAWRNSLEVVEEYEHYKCGWTNAIQYTPAGAEHGYEVNAVIAEGVFEWSKGEKSIFSYVTNFKLKKENIKEIVNTGRDRWQIETNFNVQKNSGLALESTFGACGNAALVYFMVVQLAALIRTLMTSTNYFEKLAMMESTGSTLGAKGVTFADCYRSAKAFMIHFRDALFNKIINPDKLPAGVHVVFNSA